MPARGGAGLRKTDRREQARSGRDGPRESLAGIFYTGGTTGRSKGVMLSHGNIVINALHMLSEGLLPDGTVYLNAAPMFHLANGAAMFASLIGGGTNVIVRMFKPEVVMRRSRRKRSRPR